MWTIFEWTSWLKMNKDKVELFYIGERKNKVSKLAHILTFKVGEFRTKYLGLPLPSRTLRKEDCLGVTNKIQRRIDKWQVKLLLRGDKLTLVNAVLAKLPIHFLSIYKAPKWAIRCIEALRRDFFWKGRQGTTGGPYMVAWRGVYKSKNERGLEVDLIAMNNALITKWWWRFFTNLGLHLRKLVKDLCYDRKTNLREGKSFKPASQW